MNPTEARTARRRDAVLALVTLPFVPPELPPGWRVRPRDRDEPEPWTPEVSDAPHA